MLHRLARAVPPLTAVVVAALMAVASVAFAGDRHSGRHSSSSWHGFFEKRCEGRSLSAWDRQWLNMQLQTDLFEIAGGSAAEDKASTDVVRALAADLVRDHTASFEKGAALAERLGVPVPSEPAPLQQWALRVVNAFSGTAFDRWFADLQVQGHKQAIMLAEAEVALGCNPKVRALAEASLPVLQEHLQMAEEALASLQP